MSLNQHDKDHLRFAQGWPHRSIPIQAPGTPDRVSDRSMVASVRQVGTPTAVDADGRLANLTARALLPVAGRW